MYSLFTTTGRTHPADLTERDVLDWCRGQGKIANNSARSRVSYARTFLRWCRRNDLATLDLEEELGYLRKSFPATYGKVQAANPARRLDHEQAFGALIDACKDGTWMGSRDQLIMRLGLLGIRADEMRRLTFGSLHPDGALCIQGKGHRVRTLRPGPTLLDLLARWQRQYERQIGRPVTAADPILCTGMAGWKGRDGAIYWGRQIATTDSIRWALRRRSAAAELGHVAPHDLRRTAAELLRRAGVPIRDVQKVLGHASIDTTERCYFSQDDTDAQVNAGQMLD